MSELKSYGELPITVWMNMPSPYHDDLMESLHEISGTDLQVIYYSDITAYRKHLGWEAGSRRYRHAFLRGWKPRDAVRRRRDFSGRINIFNGIWAVSAFGAALIAQLTSSQDPVFIYSEAPNFTEVRSRIRCAVRDRLGSWVARHEACRVLAVSKLSERFYQSLGFPEDRIYPFGYFRRSEGSSRIASPTGLRLCYVGALCHRKGLDILLRALDPLWAELPDLSLDLIGSGSGEAALRAYLARHQDVRARLRGALASREIPRELPGYDLLLLPSRFDGWGVVVNEALTAGVPAIVSDRCGAADLIRGNLNGFVFPAQNSEALRNCVLAFAAKSSRERRKMSDAAADTGEVIHPREAAHYLLQCVRHAVAGRGAKPQPPWLRSHENLLHSRPA